MPIDDERNGHEILVNPIPAEPAAANAALGSRFDQMFPVLSETEIGRIRRFGEVRRFPAGEFLFQAGEAVSGLDAILSGRVAIVPRDGLGQSVSVAAFAQLIGAPVEEMTEVVPGEVIAEIGQLSGRPDLSVIDARAVGDVEAIVVPMEALRALWSLRLSSASVSCVHHPPPRRADRTWLRRSGARRVTQVPRRHEAVPFPRTQRDSLPRGRSRRGSGCVRTARALRSEAGRAPDRRPVGRHGPQEPDTKQELARRWA